jgi:hypothetical protein
MDSLQVTESQSAAVATHPRVSLAAIEAAIAQCHYLSGATAANCADHTEERTDTDDRTFESLRVLTICLLVMKNGFTVIGKSAPAPPENFNPELGRKFSYEDAVRQLWPLMGFALRDRLAQEGVTS